MPRFRHGLSVAFQRQSIAGFSRLMTDATGAMLARWRPYAEVGQAIDVAAEMMHVALQIVGKALFSVEIGDRADGLAHATAAVEAGLVSAMVAQRYSLRLVPGQEVAVEPSVT